jgi:hypothetical protein
MSVRDHDPSYKASEFVTDKADAELNNGPTQHSLQRQLKNRHVAMIRYFSQPSLSVACVDSLTLDWFPKVLEVRQLPRDCVSRRTV